MTGSNPDKQYRPVVPAHGFQVLNTESARKPDSNEYVDFERWWSDYAKTLNMRATLVWQEIAWAGWFARSEVAEGKIPAVFPRKEGE